MTSSETILTVVLGLFVIVSIFLVAQQIARERLTQNENVMLRHELDQARNEAIDERKKGAMWMIGAARLKAQVEDSGFAPVWWEPTNGDPTPPPDKLAQALTLFTLEELESLCYELGIQWESLGGEGLPVRIVRMIDYAKRRGVDAKLRAAVKRERPNADL